MLIGIGIVLLPLSLVTKVPIVQQSTSQQLQPSINRSSKPARIFHYSQQNHSILYRVHIAMTLPSKIPIYRISFPQPISTSHSQTKTSPITTSNVSREDSPSQARNAHRGSIPECMEHLNPRVIPCV